MPNKLRFSLGLYQNCATILAAFRCKQTHKVGRAAGKNPLRPIEFEVDLCPTYSLDNEGMFSITFARIGLLLTPKTILHTGTNREREGAAEG